MGRCPTFVGSCRNFELLRDQTTSCDGGGGVGFLAGMGFPYPKYGYPVRHSGG